MNRACASLGLGVSMLLAAGLTAQEPDLIVNGSFEAFEATTTGTQPTEMGDWAGDATEIVEAIPVEGGVMPMDGVHMLRFIYTGRVPASSTGSELWQSVDMSGFRADIDAGRATASARAFFNRVHRDATTDNLFVLHVYAFSGNPSTFNQQVTNGSQLTLVTSSVFSDDDPTTWEEARLEFVVPPGTNFLGVLVAAVENVSNQRSGVEFHGHYVDAVSVKVAVEPGNEAPSCQGDEGPHVAVVGEPFSHTLEGIDPDAGDTLELRFDPAPPGATWSTPDGTAGVSPVEVTFDWTPGSEDVGQWDLAVHFTDSSGATTSCPFTVTVDHRPAAEIAFQRLPDANQLCHFALDGSDSSDPDHALDELSFDWTIVDKADGAVVMEMSGATQDDVALPHGDYTCGLVVTDPLSLTSRASIDIALEPEPEPEAELAIRRATVRFGDHGRITMSGRVELPPGVEPKSLDATMALNLTLAGQEVSAGWLEGMRTRRNMWFLNRRGAKSGVSTFGMRWRDARYSMSPDDLPVLIRGGKLSGSGTQFQVYLKRLKSPVTIDFAGRATVTLAPRGAHSSQGEVEIRSRRCGRRVRVQLGFEMAMDSQITVSDGETGVTRLFGDDWTPATGCFFARVKFDASAFPEGAATEPRVMDCGMLFGADGPIGVETLDLQVRGEVWRLPELEDDALALGDR